jgi:hypothetical protein
VQNFGRDVSQFEHVAIAHSAELKGYVCLGKKHIFSVGHLREHATGGHMIGMKVRVYDVADAHPGALCRAQVGAYITKGVNNGSNGLAATSKQV